MTQWSNLKLVGWAQKLPICDFVLSLLR
jgi:hypothetical protein